jgi:hypothetical protein
VHPPSTGLPSLPPSDGLPVSQPLEADLQGRAVSTDRAVLTGSHSAIGGIADTVEGPPLTVHEGITGHEGRTPGLRRLVVSWLAMAAHWLLAGKSSAWLTSFFIHVSIVLALSWLVLAQQRESPLGALSGRLAERPIEDVLDLETEALMIAAGGASSDLSAPSDQVALNTAMMTTAPMTLPVLQPWSETGEPVVEPVAETIAQPLLQRGGGLSGRSMGNRRELALAGGGSVASEAAVERGLAWLSAHQWQDGGWRFDLEVCPTCQGACRNSGAFGSTTASTGLALLSFLGAGYTQQEGPYQELVASGLYYLTERMIHTSFGGDLRDGVAGTMYSHAIATLALCEAYAMTGDENLAGPAQAAIDYIVNAQHEQGGWRYQPGDPGDTTVTGWQLAALKSGMLANLKIPYEVWRKASAFLDSVQIDQGTAYGYQGKSQMSPATIAIGLFGRMMLGWPRSHRPLMKGIARLDKLKPSKNHIYFDYYATIIIHHFGGKGWKRWNLRMREYLVKNQSAAGHERGSWYFEEPHSHPGGRLYTTAMAIMTLEVYYRYLPLYQEAMIERAP